MIRRHVLAAIAKGVAAGDEDAARAALGRIDWVLRGRALRRLNQALIDAALATSVFDAEDPVATRHLLRAAALILRRRTDVELLDRDRVAAVYAETAVIAAPSLPIASIVAAILALTMATAVGAAAVMVSDAPPRLGTATRPSPPPPIGAYRDGGAPAREAAIEQALIELPRVVAERRGPREPLAFARHEAVAAAWRDLVDSLDRFDANDTRFRDSVSDLRTYVQVLSDQLAAAGLGYFVDLEVTARREPAIAVYRIEKVTFVRADRDRVRVLDGRRLAPVEASRPVLGMKPEGLNDPVVVLDQIDEHVKTQLVPVLDGMPYALTDDWWARTARGRAASSAAGRAVRRELSVLAGSRDQASVQIRKHLLSSVRHHEAQHGFEQERVPSHPEVLAAFVGPILDPQGRANPSAVRARNELSAYTSQIASDMWLPQVVLWNLSRNAFQSSRRGTAESFAAVIIVEGLARQLKIPSPGPVIHGGEIDRDRLAALVAPIASRPTIELRSAAARLWAELFDEPLVRLVDDVFGE